MIKLVDIFNFIFPEGDEHHRAKASKMEALKTIILKLFPIMSFSINANDHIMDVSKLNSQSAKMLQIITEILEHPELEK